MRVLLDTNIVVDIFTGRPPFGAYAQALWMKMVGGDPQAVVSAVTVTTVFYLMERLTNSAGAYHAITDLLGSCEIQAVDGPLLQRALLKAWPDFEDAVQDAAAEAAGVPVIVTRDPTGFSGSTRRIVDAGTLVNELNAAKP